MSEYNDKENSHLTNIDWLAVQKKLADKHGDKHLRLVMSKLKQGLILKGDIK